MQTTSLAYGIAVFHASFGKEKPFYIHAPAGMEKMISFYLIF